jgi:hypothetical protein
MAEAPSSDGTDGLPRCSVGLGARQTGAVAQPGDDATNTLFVTNRDVDALLGATVLHPLTYSPDVEQVTDATAQSG